MKGERGKATKPEKALARFIATLLLLSLQALYAVFQFVFALLSAPVS